MIRNEQGDKLHIALAKIEIADQFKVECVGCTCRHFIAV